MLLGKIKNFSYRKYFYTILESRALEKSINDLPSKCIIEINGKSIALSKWVSPKRTRSYPYARVYDTFSSKATKTATIIPIVKDEGSDGDMDYLQWDTVSLMSLLNIYVILGYYDNASKNTRNPNKPNKITSQQFNDEFIVSQLHTLCNYHQSALHWNLNQLDSKNLTKIINLSKQSYASISNTLQIKLHNPLNIDKFKSNLAKSRENFMQYSRTKAQKAQNREFLTLQPKESIGVGEKTKITIENYLGGYYYFTIDDVIDSNNILYFIESKHSKDSILPSSDDIKDGLLKLMLYNNLSEVVDSKGLRDFRAVLRLTSNHLKSNIKLPCNESNLQFFIKNNKFSEKQKLILRTLNDECSANSFQIWIEGVFKCLIS